MEVVNVVCVADQASTFGYHFDVASEHHRLQLKWAQAMLLVQSDFGDEAANTLLRQALL